MLVKLWQNSLQMTRVFTLFLLAFIGYTVALRQVRIPVLSVKCVRTSVRCAVVVCSRGCFCVCGGLLPIGCNAEAVLTIGRSNMLSLPWQLLA